MRSLAIVHFCNRLRRRGPALGDRDEPGAEGSVLARDPHEAHVAAAVQQQESRQLDRRQNALDRAGWRDRRQDDRSETQQLPCFAGDVRRLRSDARGQAGDLGPWAGGFSGSADLQQPNRS